MAKAKIIGATVDYCLTAADAQQLNAQRNPESSKAQPGQRIPLVVDYDRGGDCVDGVLMFEGTKQHVQFRNRGFGLGQWGWRD